MKYDNYEEFEQAKIACRDCEIGLAYNRVVPSLGNKVDPTVIVIGECAGREEVEYGEPFIGKCGKLLRKHLNEYGFRRENTIITNTIPCRPLNNQFPTDTKLVSHCVDQWLAKEIEILRPRFILIVGGKALKNVMGIDGITKNRGSWMTYPKIWEPSLEIGVMATFHPSYVLRKEHMAEGPGVLESFKVDIATVSKAAGFHLT